MVKVQLLSYIVLSQISILADLRVFCANFGGEKMRLCYFYVFCKSGLHSAPIGSEGRCILTCGIWHLAQDDMTDRLMDYYVILAIKHPIEKK